MKTKFKDIKEEIIMSIDKKLCENCMKKRFNNNKIKFYGFYVSKIINSYDFSLCFKIDKSNFCSCYIDVENSDELAKEILKNHNNENKKFCTIIIEENDYYFDIINKNIKVKKNICRNYDYYLLKNSAINKDGGV